MNKKLKKKYISSDLRNNNATTSLENCVTVISTLPKQKPRKSSGKPSKRKNRKTTRIKGLEAIDFLHNQTLLSTQQLFGQKLPPPPGCADYHFTALSAMAAPTVPIHTELPPATSDTTYALQILLDLYREQLLGMVKFMKTGSFRERMELLEIQERERNQKLASRREQLRKQVHLLTEDSLRLLMSRMAELGISDGFEVKDLITKAKEITCRHQELKTELHYLQNDIPALERENERLLAQYEQERISLNESLCSYPPLPTYHLSPPSIFESCYRVLRTPGEKKFAGLTEEIKNLRTKAPSYPNENNPPIGKVHNNGHHHKSSKRSRKSRKLHRHSPRKLDEPNITSTFNQKYIPSLLLYDCEISDSTSVKMKFRTSPPVSSSPNLNVCLSTIQDSVENIINHTLSEDRKRSPQKESVDSSDNLTTDYRKVPPLKLALKRHLSREKKIAAQIGTTVGDLVNSEIEKTLEMSNLNASSSLNSDLIETKLANNSKYSSKTGEYISSADICADFVCDSPVLKLPNLDEETQQKSNNEFHQKLRVSLREYITNDSSSTSTKKISADKETKSPRHDLRITCSDCVLDGSLKNGMRSSSCDLSCDENDDDKWQEVSRGFDRMFEFVSMKIDKETKPPEKNYKSKSPTDYESRDFCLSPLLSSGPPPLHRADSPSEIEAFSMNKPSPSVASGIPFSPAPLDGPFSPVSPSSPPLLQPNLTIQPSEQNDHLNGKYYFNGKFRPKGKDWKWR